MLPGCAFLLAHHLETDETFNMVKGILIIDFNVDSDVLRSSSLGPPAA
jgi:hypothetical protein